MIENRPRTIFRIQGGGNLPTIGFAALLFASTVANAAEDHPYQYLQCGPDVLIVLAKEERGVAGDSIRYVEHSVSDWETNELFNPGEIEVNKDVLRTEYRELKIWLQWRDHPDPSLLYVDIWINRTTLVLGLGLQCELLPEDKGKVLAADWEERYQAFLDLRQKRLAEKRRL